MYPSIFMISFKEPGSDVKPPFCCRRKLSSRISFWARINMLPLLQFRQTQYTSNQRCQPCRECRYQSCKTSQVIFFCPAPRTIFDNNSNVSSRRSFPSPVITTKNGESQYV